MYSISAMELAVFVAGVFGFFNEKSLSCGISFDSNMWYLAMDLSG
jgi:hypothetical protein